MLLGRHAHVIHSSDIDEHKRQAHHLQHAEQHRRAEINSEIYTGHVMKAHGGESKTDGHHPAAVKFRASDRGDRH